MDGATKAAVVLLAADRSKSIELLKLLNPDEVRSISQGAERLGLIDAALLSSVITNFEDNYSHGLKFVGTAAEVRELISEAIGVDTAAAAMAGAPQQVIHDDPWPVISALPIEELRAFIVAQHPQVAAFILSRLDAERNAELLEQADVDLCADLMTRMLSITSPPGVIVRAIEEVLAEEFVKQNASSGGQMHAELASVINRLDRTRASDVMRRLQAYRPADAKVVERMLFRFEDLMKFAPGALTAIVERVPVEHIVVALSGADPGLKVAVMNVMSARTRRMAESEMQNGAAVSQKAAVAARQSVVDTVLSLLSAGTIELPGEQNDGPG
jgi:flagellar motor switch protein FliG